MKLVDNLPRLETVLSDLRQHDVVRRIWQGDHTVWKPDPTEITDRLGWLTVADAMREQLPALQDFAKEVKDSGFRHVVLLGMGGSSLGPEVLRQTFGSAPGYPELIVLDSTAPAWVQSVADAIDPAKTLFLVSSKSGSTIEPNAFYAHFRGLVELAVGQDQAGQHFVAITDPGTVLYTLASQTGFRRAFSNQPDIGGRYSVLSYFGLVPAALIGLNLPKLLDSVDQMCSLCGPGVPGQDNPGSWLGAVMAAGVRQNRDKLTLVTSPSIGSFGLWVEQLLAESTGKEGTGIVPIAGEPLLPPESYGQDRLFVHLRLAGDDNAAVDSAVESMQGAGHPVVRLDWQDRYDLGAEFFRWEFATAVAGSALGINPFDQPNVQSAKDQTDSVLSQYRSSGELPATESVGFLGGLLQHAKPGDYLAIMVYGLETPQLDQALQSLRRRVMERHQIATTLGYGPRFLHSTGQMHKGGPNSALFLQITVEHQEDIPIPGYPFTFGVLNNAQSAGDFQALVVSGRRAVRVNLGTDAESGVAKLLAEIT
ncbi:MAG: glucose-6-phosphate isomerase [Chloroflexi bacterium]|nr:glucose-6-phosphate isomerase [Chloroflexota bacterium]MDA1220091.1 glucose-6-phosphate isomerase [Chloroflexota bacterium]